MPTKISKSQQRREQAHRLQMLRIAQNEALEVFHQAHDHAEALQAAVEILAKAQAERKKDSD